MKLSISNTIVISLAIFCASCHAQPVPSIQGTIKSDPEWKPIVYLIQPKHFSEIAGDYLGQVIDSAAINTSGHFSFQNISLKSENSLFILTVQKKDSRFANHLIDEIPANANYMPVTFSKNDPLKFSAEITHFQKSFNTDNFSLENKKLLALRDLRFTAFDQYQETLKNIPDVDSLLIERENAFRDYANELIHFADTTSSIDAAMVAIRWISPTNDFERLPEFIVRQCEKWSAKEPDYIFIKELCKASQPDKLPVRIGDMISDFMLPLSKSDETSLLKILGDSITIVDIWASWCAPCRKENRTILAPLWNSFNKKGLQIISYSIDSDETSWKEGIAKDKMSWPQATHLDGDNSPFLHALRITTIPANFILDSHGRILAKNIFGDELERFVSERLK